MNNHGTFLGIGSVSRITSEFVHNDILISVRTLPVTAVKAGYYTSGYSRGNVHWITVGNPAKVAFFIDLTHFNALRRGGYSARKGLIDSNF